MDDQTVQERRSWLKLQVDEFSRIRPELESFERALHDLLQTASSERVPLAIVKTRVKSPGSFANKALAKREKYDCPVHEFTDLCGGRVIVRTLSEVASISQLVEDTFEIDEANSLDATTRLAATQFGYRSIHYIVSLPDNTDEDGPVTSHGFTCSICGTWIPLRAEIQVRTMAQHVWSDFTHDISYKGDFSLPPGFERRLGIIAAQLEDIDGAFADIENDLAIFAAVYGRHLSREALMDRIEHLETVLAIDERNDRLRWEIGNLHLSAQQLEKAREIFDGGIDPEDPASAYPPMLRDLGRTLWKLHEGDPDHAESLRGRSYLGQAGKLNPTDAYARCVLADTYRDTDGNRAGALYREAFDMDPSDAYALTRFLEHEIGRRGVTSLLDVVGPLSDRAIERCNAHISVGINMPWALYHKGELQLLAGEPYRALDSIARAVVESDDAPTIAEAAGAFDAFEAYSSHIEGLEWVRDFLEFAHDSKPGPSGGDDAADKRTDTVMIVGSTNANHEAAVNILHDQVIEAFADFEGTVISGGTDAGVAGIAADLTSVYAGRIVASGYVPENAPVADGYTTIHRVGHDFSPAQSLSAWKDLIAAGIRPRDVKVLGIGGGRISAAEYRIAAALGASVGIVEGSGRAADEALDDPAWSSTRTVVALPVDTETLRGFVGGGAAGFDAVETERLARRSHDIYRTEMEQKPRQRPDGEKPWEDLSSTYKSANKHQVRHIRVKLRRIGSDVVRDAHATGSFVFTPEEIELLAEMEHGRWNAERLENGWVYGPGRDNTRKIHDKIVPWHKLDTETRHYDYTHVKKIPAILAAEGYTIRRIEQPDNQPDLDDTLDEPSQV